MKLIFIILALIFTSPLAQADKLSPFAGLNTTEFDDAGNWDRKFGFEFGASYVMNIQDQLYFRTGGGIIQKNSEFELLGFSRDVDYLVLEIPATLMFDLNGEWFVFGGLNFDLVLADDDFNSEAFTITLPLGARWQVEGPHAVEFGLEFGVTDITDSGAKIGNSLFARYLYDFSISIR